MKEKVLNSILLSAAVLLCSAIVSCSDDEPTPSTSTTQTEPGPVEEPAPEEETPYEYVDLGLSVKWAAYNLGANSPEEYGDFYAWGEIERNTSFSMSNCTTWGIQLDDISGNPLYDAARANWGGTWRIPRDSEIEELFGKNTTTEWTTLNGVKGMLVTSNINDNSIFIPAAGFCYGSEYSDVERCGYLWSSTPHEDGTYYEALVLELLEDKIITDWVYRFFGCTVRAVIN